MRLDKWLQTSRLVKRRALAKELCDGGQVQVGGQAAKASTDVVPGALVCVDYGWRRLTVRVLDVDARPRPQATAAGMYRVVEERRSGPEPPPPPGDADGGGSDGVQ